MDCPGNEKSGQSGDGRSVDTRARILPVVKPIGSPKGLNMVFLFPLCIIAKGGSVPHGKNRWAYINGYHSSLTFLWLKIIGK